MNTIQSHILSHFDQNERNKDNTIELEDLISPKSSQLLEVETPLCFLLSPHPPSLGLTLFVLANPFFSDVAWTKGQNGTTCFDQRTKQKTVGKRDGRRQRLVRLVTRLTGVPFIISRGKREFRSHGKKRGIVFNPCQLFSIATKHNHSFGNGQGKRD